MLMPVNFTVPKGVTLDDGAAYRQPGTEIFPVYQFPYQPMHPRYGRLEWCLEIVPAPKRKDLKRIGAIALWTRQTDDPRYTSRVFYFPTNAEALTGNTLADNSYLRHVWRVGFCPTHQGATIFEAYVPHESSSLELRLGSSISVEARFR